MFSRSCATHTIARTGGFEPAGDAAVQKGKAMEKLWKKLEAQMIQSYESMVRDDGDVTAWNQAFDTLMKIVESGRREKHNFAPELFCLSGMEGFSFDLKIWINDYLETLEQEEDQAQMEKVCRKLLDLFAWKEEAPADLRFRLASSMLSLDKKEEAGDFCREWYLQDEDDPTAATALIYTWIAGGRLKEAQKIVDRWMEKEEGYTEENAEIFGAASLLRTVSGNISVERN